MGFLPWLRNRLFSGLATRATHRRLRFRRVWLEALEDRLVPSAVWFVNSAATGRNTGQNWTDAFTDLQAALRAAQSGDQIWVEQGIYKPTRGTDRTVSFALEDGVSIYGGFAGTETLLAQRDPAHHITTLSGDIGMLGDASDNSYHVVTSSGLDASAVLDGFTITGGAASDSSAPNSEGGGMLNDASSPTLANLIFSGNSASDAGGGLYNDAGSPTLSNVTFSSNSSAFSGSGGGGMYNVNSGAAILTKVIFTDNSGAFGGGMFNDGSSPTLAGVTFSANSATFGGGGGLDNFNGSAPYLTNVIFNGNSAVKRGGGIIDTDSSPTLIGVAFSRNTAGSDGGGMTNSDSSPTLTGVTFSGNSALQGGGIYDDSSSPTLASSILWGNTASTAGAQILDSGAASTVIASDVQGGWPGSGNIDADPLFVDAADDNLRLLADSPASRMGAYDFQPVDTTPPTSSMQSLPAIEKTTSFTVAWSGSDNTGGSGLASYNVFVSDNGGTFTPLLVNTTQTSTMFTGQNGHTYGFYSVARDNAGNIQPAPTSAQATTTVAATGSISGTAFHDYNANGIQNAGDQGLAGITVYLDLNNNGKLDAGEPTTITNTNGAYLFSNVTPGAYSVRQVPLGGVLLSTPATGSIQVTVAGGSNLTGENFGIVLTSISVPLTLPPTTAFPSHGSGNADYVEAVYRAVLNRNADAAGLSGWTALLNSNKESRLQFVQAICTSAEHFTQEIQTFYLTLLGRAADAAGMAGWVQQLQSGVREETIASDFLDSPEYLGKGDKVFIDDMYLSLLGRAFDTAGEASWLNALGDNASGTPTHAATLTHAQVVNAFLFSTESLGRLVEGYYEVYLEREADAIGLNAWVAQLKQGLPFANIGELFIASDEFYNKAAAHG